MINNLSSNILKLFLNKNANSKTTILLDLEEKSKDNIFLSEILLYLFEKTSYNYINSMNKDEKCFNESLNIFRESINILEDIIKGNRIENKNIKFLFSIGYIKVFLFRLSNDIIDKASIKNNYKNYLERLMSIINNDKLNVNLSLILGLYYNKIIYNLNGKSLINLMEDSQQQKYLMNKFKFNKIHCNRDNEFHLRYYLMPEETKMEKFKNGMKVFYQYQMNDFIGIEEKLNTLINKDINTFYIIISNLLLSKLKEDNYKDNNKGYSNFGSKYQNFITNEENKKLFDLFCFKNNFNQFKLIYSISPNEDIIILLYSLRFCLKFINNEDNNIYKNMFNENANDLIRQNYYPGNDLSDLKIYKVYSQLLAELPTAPDEKGYYICNCKPNGPFLHLVQSPDGFPRSKDKATCPFCNKKIKYELQWKNSTMRARKNYFRVFYNDSKKQIAESNKKQKEGNFETLVSFKQKYVVENLRKENKGIIKISEEFFMKEDKYIRDLSQISYRLLNYILFSNLLFSSALGYIQRKDLGNYGAEGMTCIKMIENNWRKLENELSRGNIDSIEIFMNMIFNDVTNILSEIDSIQSYDELDKIERRIEEIIKSKIDNYNLYKVQYNTHNNEFQYLRSDICSMDNLIPEKYE